MTDTPLSSSDFDRKTLEMLACPVCFAALSFDPEQSKIICTQCRRAFPLVEGIPVLIPDRASNPTS